MEYTVRVVFAKSGMKKNKPAYYQKDGELTDKETAASRMKHKDALSALHGLWKDGYGCELVNNTGKAEMIFYPYPINTHNRSETG